MRVVSPWWGYTPVKLAAPPRRSSFLNPQGWGRHLPRTDSDFAFITSGIHDGFHIVDSFDFSPAETDNYCSATNSGNKPLVEAQVRTELIEGRYVVVHSKPSIVSALGAVDKPSGGVRIIHDGSKPTGSALNDYARLEQKLRFQSLEDAVDRLGPGVFLVKVDLRSAYRSVRVHPSNWDACGLKWTFAGSSEPTYMVDTALPFGSRHAPGIFHRLTQAVRRMMARRGFTDLVVYLDDFLIIEQSYDRCLEAQRVLISLLRDLGFSIAWEKVEGPTNSLQFLGVKIDTIKTVLELPAQKLVEFHQVVRDMLARKRASLKQLQVLAGKLNWAAAVVRGGRIYLRRILEVMRPLRASHHKALITDDMREDLIWWDTFLESFNGRTWFHFTSQWVNVFVDASLKGGGMTWGSDWCYVNWESDVPELAETHINVKEILAILMAVRRWAPVWSHASVTIHTDNITARAAINKGKARSRVAMAMVREIFWWATLFNFRIKAVHIPGCENVLADAISRLHSQFAYDIVHAHLKLPSQLIGFLQHVSLTSLLPVLRQVLHWLHLPKMCSGYESWL